MTAADARKMIEAVCEKVVMQFIGTAEPATVVLDPPAMPEPVKKRTLSDEQKAKMKAGREKARAGKKGRKAEKPAAAPVAVAAVKPAKDHPAYEIKPYTTSKGVPGVSIAVGPLSCFVAKGDEEKKKRVFDAINLLRGDEAHKIAAEISRLVG